MLSPLYDELESAIMVAQMSREALSGIHTMMASQQKGEAFYDIGMGLDIPKFLRRKRGAKPDKTPMPQWILDAQPPKESWGGAAKRIQGPLLMLNEKKEAAQLLKEMEDKERAATEVKARAKRDKRLGKDKVASTETPTGCWDATSNSWRREGYISPQRYRRLVAEMPSDEHRKMFIEMYGHTQQPENREPSERAIAATRRKAVEAQQPAPAAPKEAKAAKPKDAAPAGPARERKLNPEHDAKVSAMLTRPEGASLAEIGAAMGWQEHSASAFLSGIRKTRTIVKTVEGARGNVYRLTTESKS